MLDLARALIAVMALAAVLGGCGSSTGDGPVVIEVRMLDELRYDPDHFTVSAGDVVRFKVRNAGSVPHEFFIGDQAAQREMGESHSEGHESATGLTLPPGGEGELEYRFDAPGELLVGCHEPGHYEGGMVATITIEP